MSPPTESNQTSSTNLIVSDMLYTLLAQNWQAQTNHGQTTDSATKQRTEGLHTAEANRDKAAQTATKRHDETEQVANQRVKTRTDAAEMALRSVQVDVTQSVWLPEFKDIQEPSMTRRLDQPSAQSLQTLRYRATDLRDQIKQLRYDLFALRERRTRRQLSLVIGLVFVTALVLSGGWAAINSIQAPLSTATMIAYQNAVLSGKAIIRNFDDVPMVLVPPGCFMMGSSDGNPDEQPVNRQCFDNPFWIDQTEVTNAEFARFGGQAANPSHWTDANRPRESINWFEAWDFCAKRGARLPTEAEWEYAARGPNNLVYPWGNSFIPDNLVFAGNSNNQTANVGSKLGGVSWVGAYDMAGNVWQWTSSIYKQYPYNAADGREDNSSTSSLRVLRGSSWNDYTYPSYLHATNRYGYAPSVEEVSFGVRCARSF